eukprot:7777646-Alexandrium_andersonii.AAC.1
MYQEDSELATKISEVRHFVQRQRDAVKQQRQAKNVRAEPVQASEYEGFEAYGVRKPEAESVTTPDDTILVGAVSGAIGALGVVAAMRCSRCNQAGRAPDAPRQPAAAGVPAQAAPLLEPEHGPDADQAFRGFDDGP